MDDVDEIVGLGASRQHPWPVAAIDVISWRPDGSLVLDLQVGRGVLKLWLGLKQVQWLRDSMLRRQVGSGDVAAAAASPTGTADYETHGQQRASVLVQPVPNGLEISFQSERGPVTQFLPSRQARHLGGALAYLTVQGDQGLPVVVGWRAPDKAGPDSASTATPMADEAAPADETLVVGPSAFERALNHTFACSDARPPAAGDPSFTEPVLGTAAWVTQTWLNGTPLTHGERVEVAWPDGSSSTHWVVLATRRTPVVSLTKSRAPHTIRDAYLALAHAGTIVCVRIFAKGGDAPAGAGSRSRVLRMRRPPLRVGDRVRTTHVRPPFVDRNDSRLVLTGLVEGRRDHTDGIVVGVNDAVGAYAVAHTDAAQYRQHGPVTALYNRDELIMVPAAGDQAEDVS